MHHIRISIIVPALNEEANLTLAVEEIISAFGQRVKEYEILIYNDNSDDDTGRVAEELAARYPDIRVFHNKNRQNLGGIYKLGLKESRYEYIVLIPGDNEAMPSQIIRALDYLSEVNLVVFYHKNEYIRTLKRRIISRTYTTLINLLFGTNFSYTNDTNVWKKEILNGFAIGSSDFSYQTEALIKAVRQGNSFIEMGNNIRNRVSGSTKLSVLKNSFGIIRNIARLWIEVNILDRKKYRKKGVKLKRI
jgi:glycosyltransferase involved in cell wall biosynthesis